MEGDGCLLVGVHIGPSSQQGERQRYTEKEEARMRGYLLESAPNGITEEYGKISP